MPRIRLICRSSLNVFSPVIFTMFSTYEGEIVLKEKYGSSLKEIRYVRPSAQHNLVILEEKRRNVTGWFARIFLPQGFPNSVSGDYIAYQIWDTAQAFCSTITGTLATQEVLRGVGVGSSSATPLAATITWVIKDGCGHLGKILFAYSHGTHLDAYSKKWRLYADTLNDAAMCMEIALPLFKSYTTFALCMSTVMKAIVGVAGGATRAAMTQHHAVRGNLADVSAKDSAQETAVNLVASFTALLIITAFNNTLPIFIVMIILHITCNYLAVRAVCLRTLNEPRYLQLIDAYLKLECIPTPCTVNSSEPIIFYHFGPNVLDLKLCGFKIQLGCSIKDLVKKYPKVTHLKNITEVYEERQYLLFPNVQMRIMYVLLKENASTDDVLLAYFHAVLLSIIICSLNDEKTVPVYHKEAVLRPFAQVCQTLRGADWTRDSIRVTPNYNGLQYDASMELLKYVDRIVQKEYPKVRSGLLQTGWDLSKHLLVVDEWRVSSNTKESGNYSLCDDTKITLAAKIVPFEGINLKKIP